MKFKYFILLFVMLLFTGCSVEYNLKFEDDVIKENIVIKDGDPQLAPLFDRDYYAIINAYSSKPYEKKMSNDEYDLSFDYKFDEFRNSRLLNCYDAYSLNNDNDIITFSTSRQFKCMVYDYMQIDNIVVSISTNYDVVDNNADEIDGNIYKWNINKNNASNKPIKFSYKKVGKKNRLSDFFKSHRKYLIVLLAIFGFLVSFALFIFIRNKRVNKI